MRIKNLNPTRIFLEVYFTVGLVLSAHAQPQGLYDPIEVAMLPSYCKYAQGYREQVPGGGNPAERERWIEILGSSYNNIHHYCWGLTKNNAANFHARSAQERNALLKSAVDEFSYVIERASPDFKLLPEILTKKGDNLVRLGMAPLGIISLQRAMEIKPDYWPPYIVISDFYRNTGNVKTAREWLEKGIAAAPESKTLKQRLSELDTSGSPKQPTSRPAAKSAIQAPLPEKTVDHKDP